MRCVPAPDSRDVPLANLPRVVRALVSRTAVGTDEAGKRELTQPRSAHFAISANAPPVPQRRNRCTIL